MNDLTIHRGTVVCPVAARTTSAERCECCDSYRGRGRANSTVICVPAALPKQDPKPR